MKVLIKKDTLKDLIDSVVLPSIDFLLSIKNKKEVLELFQKVKFLHLLLYPFADDKAYYKSMIEEMLDICKKDSTCKEFVKFALPLYEEWLKKHSIEIAIPHLNNLKNIIEEENEDIEFFDLDSDFELDDIDDMHYKDEEKISAQEFNVEDYIDKELQDDIKEDLSDIDFLKYSELNKEYIEVFLKVINNFIHVFNISFEFKDLSIALEKLVLLLEDYDFTNNELMKLLLDSILEDLKKWFESVIVRKEAVDIHYLDASLLANIAQIEIILSHIKE